MELLVKESGTILTTAWLEIILVVMASIALEGVWWLVFTGGVMSHSQLDSIAVRYLSWNDQYA